MSQTVAIEVTTPNDPNWVAKWGAGQVEERTIVPGCTITGRWTFRGRDWVNYTLPTGCPLPTGWDKGVQNALAAPAEWTH